MKNFKTLVENILNESPVAVDSKSLWVSSILHRLALNRSDTSSSARNVFKAKYQTQGTYTDVVDANLQYFDEFATILTQKLKAGLVEKAKQTNEQPTNKFALNHLNDVLKLAKINLSSEYDNSFKESLKDLFEGSMPDSTVTVSALTMRPFIVEIVVDKMFDDVFAEETTEIQDYQAAKGASSRTHMSKSYPFSNVSETDKQWDEFIVYALRRSLENTAKEISYFQFKINENKLKYTARLVAQATEGIAITFPVERTGMGRGSGGDKRRAEEIMTASANKREMVARSTAAVEDAEEFNKYDYIFSNTDADLNEHEQELLASILDALPAKGSSARYTSTEVVQSCIRNSIFTVPARVRSFMKTLIEKGVVQAIPVVKKAAASTDIDDLFD